MILNCQNIYRSFGENNVLNDISFHLEKHEKAALIGNNGAGKSTLMRIIAGVDEPTSGSVITEKGLTIGYLAQQQDIRGHRTVIEEMYDAKKDVFMMENSLRALEAKMKHSSPDELAPLMAEYDRMNHAFENASGYAARSEITGILKGLGFSENDFSLQISALSGGQKTRVALGKILLQKPDLLMLDEPTNHLDMNSVRWLETLLQGYSGSVLLISHDRYFLDALVTKVIELENGKSTVYSGNYTAFSEKKAQLRHAQLRAWLNQQQEIRHQEEVIAKLRSFNREKSIRRAESREKLLERTERLEKPVDISADMHLRFRADRESGNEVLTAENLSKAYGNNVLFEGQNFTVRKGERVAIIGDNGTGKTTILKIIMGDADASTGSVRLGSNVDISYFDQEHQKLSPEKTVFDEIGDSYPALTQTEIRNLLAAFLFTDDDVFKQIKSLSGGEQGRVSLAKLMLGGANFLILDEPTNHLDIVSREILEEALRDYKGTVLFVSHDRYFINRVATRILNLVNHTLVNYIGNYDYYLEKKDELTAAYAPAAESGQSSSDVLSDGKAEYLSRKAEQARLRKIENDLRKTEERIAGLEEQNRKIDEEFSLPETGENYSRCRELSEQKAEIEKELEMLYEVWEELSEM